MIPVFLFILAVCLQIAAMTVAVASGDRHANKDRDASILGFGISVFLGLCAVIAAGLGGAL
jgi:hypothetical protein